MARVKKNEVVDENDMDKTKAEIEGIDPKKKKSKKIKDTTEDKPKEHKKEKPKEHKDLTNKEMIKELKEKHKELDKVKKLVLKMNAIIE